MVKFDYGGLFEDIYMNELELLADCPLISVQEAAEIQQVNESTVRRHFDDQRTDGLATFHVVGRAGRHVERWQCIRRGATSLYVYPERVPWSLTEGGLRSALRRVEWHSATYRYASKLFQQAREDWFTGDAIPNLLSCQFIRGPRNADEKPWLSRGF